LQRYRNLVSALPSAYFFVLDFDLCPLDFGFFVLGSGLANGFK
jgi:hypothetical protein